MATATSAPSTTAPQESRPDNANQVIRQQETAPAIGKPRLPYHPLFQERFGIDKSSWKALVEAIFPNATSVESVLLALSYCRARKLDPFKRNVHIVPIWDKNRKCMVDTIWPGIGELRTTAFRTGEYAGRDQTQFGPDVTMNFGVGDKARGVTFPEWAQATVFRVVKGQRVAFAGPRVYWLETYATERRDSDVPNDMWGTRPRGQIEKCAEAAALRAAFPEEVGTDYIADEIKIQTGSPTKIIEAETAQATKSDQLAARLAGHGKEANAEEGSNETQETADTTQETTREPGDDDGAQANYTPGDPSEESLPVKLAACKTKTDVMVVKQEFIDFFGTPLPAWVEPACEKRTAEIVAARSAGGKQGSLVS